MKYLGVKVSLLKCLQKYKQQTTNGFKWQIPKDVHKKTLDKKLSFRSDIRKAQATEERFLFFFLFLPCEILPARLDLSGGFTLL